MNLNYIIVLHIYIYPKIYACPSYSTLVALTEPKTVVFFAELKWS